MNGARNIIFFIGPAPWGPREGSKGQVSFNFNYKVNFKDFYSKLCGCSHKWKIQNISDGIYSVAWVMPQGWDFGALGVPMGSKNFFQTWSCGISNRRGWQAEQNASNIFILGSNWWPWGEVKRSNIINMSISKIFISNSLCVFSQIKDRKHIEQNFHSVARVMPRGGTCGCWGSQKL